MESWLKKIILMDGKYVQINTIFRHKSCFRVSISIEPCVGLTCNMCANFFLRQTLD